jgi:hypothetical protein
MFPISSHELLGLARETAQGCDSRALGAFGVVAFNPLSNGGGDICREHGISEAAFLCLEETAAKPAQTG